MIPALCVLLAAQVMGELIVGLLGWPIPGPIIGMLLLFGGLQLRQNTPAILASSAQTLLRYLPLILIPPSVGVMAHWPLLREHALLLLAVIVGSTALSLLVAGGLSRMWQR